MDRILVAYDASERAEAALEYAIEHHPSAEVILVRAINPGEIDYSPGRAVPDFPEIWLDRTKERVERELRAAARRAAMDGVATDTVLRVGRPAETIVEVAEDRGVDLIVVGSHGRSGVSRILLGSVAESVMRRSPVPVTVVR